MEEETASILDKCLGVGNMKGDLQPFNFEEFFKQINLEPNFDFFAKTQHQHKKEGRYDIIRFNEYFCPESMELPNQAADHKTKDYDLTILNPCNKNKIYYRERSLIPKNCLTRQKDEDKWQIVSGNKQCYKALADSMLMFARRRGLFSPDFGCRLFNIFLPPAYLCDKSNKSEAYLVIPVLTLVRIPNCSTFRRTITLSLLVFPERIEEQDNFESAKLHPVELNKLKSLVVSLADTHDRWIKNSVLFSVKGPITEWSKFQDSMDELNSEVTFSRFRKIIFIETVKMLFPNLLSKKTEDLQSRVFNSLSRSNVSCGQFLINTPESFCPKTDDLFQDLSRKNKNNHFVLNQVYNLVTLAYPSSVTPREIDLSELALPAEKVMVEQNHLSIFEPSGSWFVAFSPDKHENFPNVSIKNGIFWDIYIIIGLSLVKEMISAYYHEIESKGSLESMLKVSNEFVKDFEEIYAIDFINPIHKKMYETAKHLAGLDTDYAYLKEKINSLREELTVKSANLMSKLVAFLAVVSIMTAIYTATVTIHSLELTYFLAFITALIISAIAIFALWMYRPKLKRPHRLI